MPDQADGRKDGGTPEHVPAEKVRDHLGNLLGRVEHGREEFVITKLGKPVAKLVPLAAA